MLPAQNLGLDMSEPLPVLLSIGFLRRPHYNKVTQREMIQHGLRPLDLMRDGSPAFDKAPLAIASEMMSKAAGYLTIIDTQHIMKDDKKHAEQLRLEFDEAVANGLPIGLLVVKRRASAPKYVDKRLEEAAEQFKLFHARKSRNLNSLMTISVEHDDYLTGLRDLFEFLRSRTERADDSGLVVTLPTIPDQSPAPIRVEERNGKVSRISDRDSPLASTERDFNDWREPVFDHIQEMLAGDFHLGTNHSRARDRLVALATLLAANIAEIKERQFRVGYEIERLGGLVSAYRSGGDDMPVLSADVLEDLDRLRIALVMGIAKLERWSEFRHAATAESMHDGDANLARLSEGLSSVAVEMERRPTYFDPELPETFRFLAEAAGDPLGATRTVLYGGVRSAENLISFLGRKALGIGATAVGAIEQHISKAVAALLITGLSGAALTIAGAIPEAWPWLRPLLDALTRAGGQ
jgi:hypothetical protein